MMEHDIQPHEAADRVSANTFGLWKRVIGDAYQPAVLPGIKHMHVTTIERVFREHAGTEVADVIAGLLFQLGIEENRTLRAADEAERCRAGLASWEITSHRIEEEAAKDRAKIAELQERLREARAELETAANKPCPYPHIYDRGACCGGGCALPQEGDRSTWIDSASGETGPAEFHAGEWRER